MLDSINRIKWNEINVFKQLDDSYYTQYMAPDWLMRSYYDSHRFPSPQLNTLRSHYHRADCVAGDSSCDDDDG